MIAIPVSVTTGINQMRGMLHSSSSIRSHISRQQSLFQSEQYEEVEIYFSKHMLFPAVRKNRINIIIRIQINDHIHLCEFRGYFYHFSHD